jgi:hypothetical protein
MYFGNISIDTGVQPLARIFDIASYSADGFNERVQDEPYAATSYYSSEPVYWPDYSPTADIRYMRGFGAMAHVQGGTGGLLLNLNPNSPYPTVLERDYLGGVVHVTAQPNSVVADLKGRSFWGNVADNIRAPMLGKGDEATMAAFVAKGGHAEGVCARVLAFALEHALCPFSTRLRVRNAAACYWCLGRYRSDGITFSIQDTQGAMPWSSPSVVGEENEPVATIWVDTAKQIKGMALLSRIYDVGGPVFGQRAYMLGQFEPGRLLMVGTGGLSREFPNVQANDFWDAIREALYILQEYNNVSQGFIDRMLHTLIHNLPVVDAGHVRERNALFWRVRGNTRGDLDISVGADANLEARVNEAFGVDAAADLFGGSAVAGNPDVLKAMVANTARDVILAPGVDGADWAPPLTHVVAGGVAAMIAVQLVGMPHPVRGEQCRITALDPDNLPMLNAGTNVLAREVAEVWPILSGRNAVRLFFYSAPDVAMDAIVYPNAVQVAQADLEDYGLIARTPAADDGHWWEWTRDHVAGGGQLDDFPRGLRAYVVRSFMPVRVEQYMPTFSPPPPGRLRNFDVGGVLRLGLNNAGVLPDMIRHSPRVQRYCTEVDTTNTFLEFLDPDGLRNVPNAFSNTQKSMLVIRGYATAWEACHLGATQNDAYRRWIVADRVAENITTVQDEMLLYLGGCRVHKYIEPAGGLWALCFLEKKKVFGAVVAADTTIQFLRDRHHLGSFILKLRCTVEVVDVLLRTSNARILGCAEPFLYDDGLRDRLDAGDCSDPTIKAPGQYLTQQATVMASLFANTHGTAMLSFGVAAVGGLRLREPRVGGGLHVDDVRHMNWLAPQILPQSMWALYLGVSPPTFRLDRKGRQSVSSAKYTTQWTKLSSGFKNCVFPELQDEAWMAILTTVFGDCVDLLTVSIAAFGSDAEVYVGDLRERYSWDLVPFASRLFLPHETRMRRFGLLGTDSADERRPVMDNGNTWRGDGDDLVMMRHAYDDQGRFQPGAVVAPGAIGASIIDATATIFGSDGVRVAKFESLGVNPTYPEAHKSSGHYWLTRVKENTGALPAHTPALSELFAMLRPPPTLPVVEHDDGLPIVDVQQDRDVAADPDLGVQPGVNEGGNLPIHEREPLTLQGLVSRMQGLDPMSQRLLSVAFLKKEFGDDASVAISAIIGGTELTVGSTTCGTSGAATGPTELGTSREQQE